MKHNTVIFLIVSFLVGAALLFGFRFLPKSQVKTTEAHTYTIEPSQSTFTVHVSKAGLLSGAGHEHVIAIKSFGGHVQVSGSGVQKVSLELEVEAKSLTVADKGISDKDRSEIQKTMETDVLNISHFPKIIFRSIGMSNVKPVDKGNSFTLNGNLTLHGITKRVAVQVVAVITKEQVHATGEVMIKQTDFGIKPYSTGLGTVKVKNELKLSFAIIAKAS